MPPGMYAIISSLQCPCAPSSLHHLSSLELVRTKVYTSALSHLIECGHASLPACISASLHLCQLASLGERFGRAVCSDIISGHADTRMKSHQHWLPEARRIVGQVVLRRLLGHERPSLNCPAHTR